MYKNWISVIVIVYLAFSGCSGKKDFSAEQAFLNTWALAIKNRDYQQFSKYEAYPRSADQFMEMYRDYYFSDISVMDVSKAKESQLSGTNEKIVRKEVRMTGSIVMRKDQKQIKFNGTVDFIKKETKPEHWQLTNRVVSRSE